MLKLIRTLTTAAAIVFSMAPSISAQKTAPDADEKEVAAYRLTMDAVKRWENVIRYLGEWAKNDPQAQAQIKLEAAIDSLRKKEELTEAEQARLEKLEQQLEAMDKSADDDLESDPSVAELAAEVSKFKPATDALRRAGMTPREYVVFSLALLEASAYVAMKKAGVAADPKDFNAANAKFVEEHAAQLEALQKEMDKVSKAIPASARKGS